MDKKFVITQLINAALTVATTIIVVRFTMKGNLGISPRFKQRLKSTTGKYGGLVINFFALSTITLALIRWVGLHRFEITNRAEVFIICVLTFFGLRVLAAVANELLDIVAPEPKQ
jgi:hypothetical protein